MPQIGDAQVDVGAALSATFSRAACIASGSSSMRDDRRGAEPAGGDRQHARAGADVDDRAAARVEPLQRREAQPRRRVMAGAEAHRRLDDDRRSACEAAPDVGGRREAPGQPAARPTAARRRCCRPARRGESACDRAAQSSSGTSSGAKRQLGELAVSDRGRAIALGAALEEDAPGVRRRFVDGGDVVVDERGLQEVRRAAAVLTSSAGQVRMRLPEDVLDAVEEALVVLLVDAVSARTSPSAARRRAARGASSARASASSA